MNAFEQYLLKLQFALALASAIGGEFGQIKAAIDSGNPVDVVDPVSGGPIRTKSCPCSPHQPLVGPNRQPSKACRVVSRKMALMTAPSCAHISSAAA